MKDRKVTGIGVSLIDSGHKPSILDMVCVSVKVPRAAADKLNRLAKAADCPRWLVLSALILSADEEKYPQIQHLTQE